MKLPLDRMLSAMYLIIPFNIHFLINQIVVKEQGSNEEYGKLSLVDLAVIITIIIYKERKLKDKKDKQIS